MKDWWVYDIASDEWTQLEDLPAPERHHPYQFAANGKIYTGFGHGNEAIFNTWFEYNPSSATWTELDHLPSEGRVAGTQFSYGGYGFALSGDGDEHTSMETGEFWQYLPTTDSWVALTPHPGESRWAPSSFVIGTDLYFMNGMSNLFGQWQYNMENFKIDLESVVNVEEANASTSGALSGPEVYPTATNGLFNVQGGAAGAVLEVLDLTGRVLLTYACNANGEVLGDLSGLANGAYLVHWAGSDEPASRIIKH
jgi:N-acetylneuraminic acid mutarotase